MVFVKGFLFSVSVTLNIIATHLMFESVIKLPNITKKMISNSSTVNKSRNAEITKFLLGLALIVIVVCCWFLHLMESVPVTMGFNLAYLILRCISLVSPSHWNLNSFANGNDRTLLLLQEKNFGSGLAQNYWDGLLRHILYKDPSDKHADKDVIERMEESGIKFSTSKFVILVPRSASILKDCDRWLNEYNMEKETKKAVKPVGFVNRQVSQRESSFVPLVTTIHDPKGRGEKITLCFDFPQILRSGLNPKKYNDPPEQRNANVDRFITKLRDVLHDHHIQNKVRIVDYDDSNLHRTKDLYELVAQKILDEGRFD